MTGKKLNIVLISNSHVVVLLIFVALWFYPPKNRNAVLGYRTSQSFETQRNWDFAQKYSAKLGVIVFGCATLLGIALPLIFKRKDSLFVILSLAMTVLSLFAIIGLTEYKLGKLPEIRQNLEK